MTTIVAVGRKGSQSPETPSFTDETRDIQLRKDCNDVAIHIADNTNNGQKTEISIVDQQLFSAGASEYYELRDNKIILNKNGRTVLLPLGAIEEKTDIQIITIRRIDEKEK